MKRLGAIALVVVAMIWVRRLGSVDAAGGGEQSGVALALGFSLVVALVTGELFRRFRLPRLTGYLLFGVLVGPYLGNLVDETMARQLQVINGIATTLIALIAGLTLNIERIGPRLGGIARLTATTLAVAMAGLGALAWLVWPWLPVAPEATGLAKLTMVVLVAIIAVSFSPTMTAAVVSETGSRGRLSDLVLAVVVFADLIVLVVFSVAVQGARFVFGQDTGEVNVLIRLAWEIGGAVAFGSLVGALFALYLRYVAREVTVVLIGVCVVLSQVGLTERVEPLLAALAAGMVIENVAVAQGDALKIALQRAALPVLVVFFVAVGTSLRLDALVPLGVVAALLVLVRVALIRIGVAAGLRTSGLREPVADYLWTGLISQAGITLGLASVLATEFPTWGSQVQLLIVAVIALDELVGPAAFRTGLAQAGEIDASTPRPLVVVSNREPYLHNKTADGRVTVSSATGGVAVALDALMRERGGVWIAHGAGTADREHVDASSHVIVPPESPSYRLRRLWLDPEEFARYYGGFANEGLWPLCHVVDVRPKFRAEDWEAYQAVNAQFAEAIDTELGVSDSPVFIQDYHLALVAPRLRARGRMHGPRSSGTFRGRTRTVCASAPGAATCWWDSSPTTCSRSSWNATGRISWPPWKTSSALRLKTMACGCGSRNERPRSCRCRSAWITTGSRRSAATMRSRSSRSGSRPSSTSTLASSGLASTVSITRRAFPSGWTPSIGVLTRRPDLRGQLTFLQIGVPSRSDLESYSAIESEIDAKVAELNAKHRPPDGGPLPVHYHKAALNMASLVALYRMADFCIVSSLHDGMNLVAKEFVAARDDEDGVLILSALAGAAQELSDALIINPYDVDGFAGAIVRAIDMPPDAKRARMRAMRRVVAGRNVFGWASDILEGLESLWTKPLLYAARAPEETPV